MSDHCTQFEATGGGMMLTNAILLYRNETRSSSPRYSSRSGDGEAFASIHRVEHRDEGGPIIAAGTPLTRAHLRQWTEALGKSAAPEVLPPNILVSHPDVLAWWVPAHVRAAYFNLSRPPAGLRALSARTIVRVPYPAHLLIATRRTLGVYALPSDERPTSDSTVLHSPILNVFVDGSLCWGDIPRPKTLSVSAIPEFESALFDSWSTHLNPGQELTVSGRGGLIELWDNLAARQAARFPVERLRPFVGDRRQGAQRKSRALPGMTLGKLIARSAKR
jgi:PRTRC genetic system protein B